MLKSETQKLLFHVRFMLRHADSELLSLLSESVPPADISKIQIFKSQLSKFVKKAGLQQTHVANRTQSHKTK